MKLLELCAAGVILCLTLAPRLGWAEFHEAPGVCRVYRSWCPTKPLPSPLLVQFRQVRSSPGGKAVPSIRVPVMMSWKLGESPLTPEFTVSPRSFSA